MRDRWLSWGRRLQMAGLAASLMAAVVWAGSPAGAANDISVTPNTGLTDGQEVIVTLGDWPFEQAFVTTFQCRPSPQSLDDCGGSTDANIVMEDGQGTATRQVSVLSQGDVICDNTHPCSLVAVLDPTNFLRGMAEASLTFSQAVSTTTTTPTTAPTGSSSTTSTTAPSATSTTTTAPSATSTTTTAPTGNSSTTTTTAVTSTRAEATPSDPVATKVSSPVPGVVQVSESKTTTTPAPGGLTLVGAEVKVTGPSATTASPLKLEFRLDGSLMAGKDEMSAVVLRNGTTVVLCTGSPQAVPDPCLAGRTKAGDDVILTVLSSQAGTWNFAASPMAAAGTTTTTTGASGSTAATRQGSATATSGTGGGTLPVTGLRSQMVGILVIGLGLAAGGSLLRHHALRTTGLR